MSACSDKIVLLDKAVLNQDDLAAEIIACLDVRSMLIRKGIQISSQIECAFYEVDPKKGVDDAIIALFLKKEGTRKKKIEKAIAMCVSVGMTEDEANTFITEDILLELFSNPYTKSLRRVLKKRWGFV